MHVSSYIRMKYLLDWYRPYFEKKSGSMKVLDIGSWGTGKTYRDFFGDSNWTYHGLDMAPADNVDIVPEDIYSWKEIGDDTYDLVISGQCFEHIEFPWLTIKEIARVLKPSGFCIITAPNAGLEHKAPMDCYRYFGDGFRALAKWAKLYVHHTSIAGVPILDNVEEWKNRWNDAFLVAQKPPVDIKTIEDPFPYEMRWLQDNSCFITYKNDAIAADKIKEKYSDGNKFILYGAGNYGARMIKALGNDAVAYFCDGNKERTGQKYCGKTILSPEEMKAISQDYHVIVSACYDTDAGIVSFLQEAGIPFEKLFWEKWN